MFGTNPVRKQELTDGSELFVQSIFYTIQGEGPFAGMPAVFIRLAGCNLRCFFCDTEFESGMNAPKPLTTILNEVNSVVRGVIRKPPLVVLTGGEPLRQNVAPLIAALELAGFPHVQIETAGTLWIPELESWLNEPRAYASIVCSPKTPKVHPKIEQSCEHWKYIIRAGTTSYEDGLPSFSTHVEHEPQMIFRTPRESDTVWLQPCDEHTPAMTKVNTEEAVRLAMRHGYRLCIQIHKVVGVE